MKGHPDRHTVIRCINPNCPAVLGTCTVGRFFPAGATAVVVVSRVVLLCQSCGKKRTWRPGEIKLDHSRE